jgi:hypothetical protein
MGSIISLVSSILLIIVTELRLALLPIAKGNVEYTTEVICWIVMMGIYIGIFDKSASNRRWNLKARRMGFYVGFMFLLVPSITLPILDWSKGNVAGLEEISNLTLMWFGLVGYTSGYYCAVALNINKLIKNRFEQGRLIFRFLVYLLSLLVVIIWGPDTF